ncbi:hypothetical protein AW168_31620 [Nocardia brasiliensis]|nr:hypothetical protein AW168_31620 [Nocardia brasiliensis]
MVADVCDGERLERDYHGAVEVCAVMLLYPVEYVCATQDYEVSAIPRCFPAEHTERGASTLRVGVLAIHFVEAIEYWKNAVISDKGLCDTCRQAVFACELLGQPVREGSATVPSGDIDPHRNEYIASVISGPTAVFQLVEHEFNCGY